MLLASLVPGGVPRVGFLDCPFVLPIAGHDAFASSPPAPQRKKKKGKKKGSAGAPSVLSVNVEGARDPHHTRSAPDGASPGGWRAVFLDKARGLTILQMRAPVAPVRQPHRRCGLAWAWLGRALASPPALADAGPAPRALRDACRLDPGTFHPAELCTFAHASSRLLSRLWPGGRRLASAAWWRSRRSRPTPVATRSSPRQSSCAVRTAHHPRLARIACPS